MIDDGVLETRWGVAQAGQLLFDFGANLSKNMDEFKQKLLSKMRMNFHKNAILMMKKGG